MSTLTVVQKDGFVAIAADQMTTTGSCKCLGRFKSHPNKIVRVGTSLIGVAGSTANVRVVESLAGNHSQEFNLSSNGSIFETFRRVHKLLVEEYFLLTEEKDDDGQPYESSQLNLLIANDTGIYEVEGYREVIKFERFWATGSGFSYALGAMQALYDEDGLSAQQVAEKGVEAGCLFDDSSDLPVESYQIRLKE